MVPIDFNMEDEALKRKLQQLNGIYIPGSSKNLVTRVDYPYTKAVQRILKWAQAYNDKED